MCRMPDLLANRLGLPNQLHHRGGGIMVVPCRVHCHGSQERTRWVIRAPSAATDS
jgi:hypothetical protein